MPDEPMYLGPTAKHPIGTYYDGARHALHRFAWRRDGVEYVGSTGYTLERALVDVDRAEVEGRTYSL